MRGENERGTSGTKGKENAAVVIRSYQHFWVDELGALVRLDLMVVSMVEKRQGVWEEVFSAGMSSVTAPQDTACFSEKSDGDEKQTTHGIHSVSASDLIKP